MKKLSAMTALLLGCSVWLNPGTASAGLFGSLSTDCCDNLCSSGGCCESAACAEDICGTDGCCDNSCGESCGLFGCSDIGLCGFIQPSDRCFDDFISPMINFVFFEDPRNVTEIRPIFVNHSVPNRIGNGGAVPAGGNIQLLAVQFRVALTERLSLIGVKDGFIFDNTNGALDNLLNDGWSSVTAGLKYNFHRDTVTGTLGSIGFTYEIPLGSNQALQNVADGEFHFFLTGGKRLLNGDAHILTSLGYRQAVDTSAQNSAFHWSSHVDYRVTDKLYVFTEAAWWHWTDHAGGGGLPAVGGQDLFNLTSTNLDGQNLVTQSVGVKLKPNRATEIGLAYEFPLTGFDDVIENRLMVDLILRY